MSPRAPAVPWLELLGLLRPGVEASDPAWRQLRAALDARASASTPTQWDTIAQAARHAEVAVLAAEAHPELARRLDVAVRRQTLVDMNLELALDRVARAIADVGHEHVALIKGEATAHTLYDRPSQRFRRDVDLLVSREAFPVVIASLVADGWRQVASGDEPATATAWPLVLDLPIGELACDLHQEVFEPGAFRVDTAAVLARAERGRSPLPLASAEDNLLITAGHMAQGGFQEPLKAWVDLQRLATSPTLDHAAVASRARAWGLVAATWACLHVLARWWRTPSARLTAAVRPPPAQRALLAWLLAGDGAHPVRRDVSRHAAKAATGPLTCDDAAALRAWTAVRVGRRVPGGA